jgi:adenylate cyclase
MPADLIERKLAAILSADVVGYSRLMAEDEAGTVQTLTAYRDEIALLIQQHRGRVVDAPGDNILAEFPTATDAVGCAVEIQGVLRVRNSPLPLDRKMEFRIGIHLGEVRVEGDRIYGDGVNVAARLEGLAECGGISISGIVYTQIRNKLELAYEDLGDQSVKNIPDPIRVYRIQAQSEPVTADLVLPGMKDRTVPGFHGAPAIAVLPFDNLSGDPEQEYFADGIVEDLITRLSAWRSFPVIARNSSFTYKGRAMDVKQVSRDLGVRYVVEGSVRKAADRVRISAQLIDASTGQHVWAERYDRELSDIFSVQDEISETIVASMSPELSRFEMERVAYQARGNLDAWDSLVRGSWHFWLLTEDDNARARVLFEEAAELDPRLARAFVGIAGTHWADLLHQWTGSPDRSVDELDRAARRSVALDDREPSAHLFLAWAHSFTGQEEKAIAASELAVQLNPSFAMAYAMRSTFLARRGRPDDAIASIEKAMRLSPQDPMMWVILQAMAVAHFVGGRYHEAAKWAEQSLQRKPDAALPHRFLAASYAHLGRLDEARRALDEALRLTPGFSLAAVRLMAASADPAFRDPLIDGLRKAGLPE